MRNHKLIINFVEVFNWNILILKKVCLDSIGWNKNCLKFLVEMEEVYWKIGFEQKNVSFHIFLNGEMK